MRLWDSSIGWTSLAVSKRYSFKLLLSSEGGYLGARLERSILKSDFSCKRRKLHWKFGSFRVVYLCKLDSEQRVAKFQILPRGKEEDKTEVELTLQQYLLAHELTKKFVKTVSEKQGCELKMRYVKTDVLELPDGQYVSTEECCGAEFDKSHGNFIKWNNNDNFVNPQFANDPYPQALSHFSFVESKQSLLLTDVQGWKTEQGVYILTDPALHTNEKQGGKHCGKHFGPSDVGYKGMQSFFAVHKCNEICRLLGLHKEHRPNPPRAKP